MTLESDLEAIKKTLNEQTAKASEVKDYVQEMLINVSHNAVDASGKLCYVEPEMIMKEAINVLQEGLKDKA